MNHDVHRKCYDTEDDARAAYMNGSAEKVLRRTAEAWGIRFELEHKGTKIIPIGEATISLHDDHGWYVQLSQRYKTGATL